MDANDGVLFGVFLLDPTWNRHNLDGMGACNEFFLERRIYTRPSSSCFA